MGWNSTTNQQGLAFLKQFGTHPLTRMLRATRSRLDGSRLRPGTGRDPCGPSPACLPGRKSMCCCDIGILAPQIKSEKFCKGFQNLTPNCLTFFPCWWIQFSFIETTSDLQNSRWHVLYPDVSHIRSKYADLSSLTHVLWGSVSCHVIRWFDFATRCSAMLCAESYGINTWKPTPK